MSKHSVEILGPRDERPLLVNGWYVPFVEAHEQTGGKILFVVDDRFGFEVGSADFEEVARFAATVYAIAIGMRCWPHGDEDSPEDLAHNFAHVVVPPTCFPRRMVAIEGFETEVAEAPDDPR